MRIRLELRPGIDLRDNGMGLAPEVIPQIFEMFTRVRSKNAPSEGGLGIALGWRSPEDWFNCTGGHYGAKCGVGREASGCAHDLDRLDRVGARE
jgi:hypothetical protein